MSENYTKWIDDNKQILIEISDFIWENPELGLFEEKSSKKLSDTLEQNGFSVKINVANMPTAFVASYGTGKPVIAILGEFDALPGLSQDRVTHQSVLRKDEPGHGCGHNLLGTGSLGACLAVKNAIESGKVNGTIRYFGTPAEEMFNAKGYMIINDLFEDVDIALSWHPSSVNTVNYTYSQAVNSVIFRFHGRTAHAAADPQNGRSALDAVELMNVGCNYLREHINPRSRLHYTILKGGEAPNIVPAEAEVWYFIRTPKRGQIAELYKRVKKVAQGAALMTETTLEVQFLSGMYDTRYTETVQNVLEQKLKEIGPPKFDEKDYEMADEISQSYPKRDIELYIHNFPEEFHKSVREMDKRALCNIIFPPMGKGKTVGGSTDVGDICHKIPTAEISIACCPLGCPAHSWQITASSGLSIGHKGMLTASKVLALTAMEFMNNPVLVKKARDNFLDWTKGRKYLSPFPDGLMPPFHLYEKNSN